MSTATARQNEAAAGKIGILLVNLGTPDEPTPKAVRRYLKEFLSDRRVVEIPRIPWWLILNLIILNTRPKLSAAKYAAIWMPEGSPLRVHTERQARLLQGFLGDSLGNAGGDAPRLPIEVDWAMRYGSRPIVDALTRLHSNGCSRILVIPLYPQRAASTVTTAKDEVARFTRGAKGVEVRSVRGFHRNPGYIEALAQSVRQHWEANGRPAKLLMSFHGLPRYTVVRGDPYKGECEETAKLLAAALKLPPDQWQLSFQSRFGRAAWIEPYTTDVLTSLAQSGASRVDVICPGFVSDCLETLEEIGIEGKAHFLAAGGQELQLIPCLNEREDWIHALRILVRAHLGDWIPGNAAAKPATPQRIV